MCVLRVDESAVKSELTKVRIEKNEAEIARDIGGSFS